MSVPQLIKQLKSSDAAIGCRLHIYSAPLRPDWTTVVIIPDHPMAIQRFEEFGVFDGIGISVPTGDTDKVRSNSNYYRELLSLQEQFKAAERNLQALANAISAVDSSGSRHEYSAALERTKNQIDANRKLH